MNQGVPQSIVFNKVLLEMRKLSITVHTNSKLYRCIYYITVGVKVLVVQITFMKAHNIFYIKRIN